MTFSGETSFTSLIIKLDMQQLCG